MAERRHRRDRAEQDRITLHLAQNSRLQDVARDLDLQQPFSGERRILLRPVEKLQQVRVDLAFAARDQRLEQQPRRPAEDLPPQLARLFQAIRPERLHVESRVLQPADRLPDRPPGIGVHRDEAVVLEEPDA